MAYTQGDIRRERFKDVWDKKYQIFRDRSWTKKDECAACNHYYHCKGSGLHLYDTPESKLMRCLYKMAKEAEEDPKDPSTQLLGNSKASDFGRAVRQAHRPEPVEGPQSRPSGQARDEGRRTRGVCPDSAKFRLFP